MENSSSFGSSVNSLTSSSYVLLLCSSAFRDRSRRMRRTYRRRRTKSRIRTRRTNGIARKTGSAFRIWAKRDAPAEARWRNQEAACTVPFQNAAKWEATDEKETVDDAGALEMAGSGVWVMAGVSVGVAVAVGVGVAVGTGSNVTARV